MTAFDDTLAGGSKIHPIRWHDKYPAAAELERSQKKGPAKCWWWIMEATKAMILSAFEKKVHICPADWSRKTCQRCLPEWNPLCKESEQLPMISSRPNRSEVRILLFTAFWPAPCL